MKTREVYLTILILFSILFGITFSPKIFNSPIFNQILIVDLSLLCIFLFFLYEQFKASPKCWFEINLKLTHLIQALAQSSIYIYCSLYTTPIPQFAPFIVYQIAFAFLFDFILSVFVKNKFSLGFSIFPVVLSINLFMWFKPNYFLLQLLVVVFALVCKMLIVRKKGSQPAHIFNPSAMAMATAAFIIVIFRLQYITNVGLLVNSYFQVPYIHLFIFIAGTFSHLIGRVSFISMGAVGALIVINTIFLHVVGQPFLPEVISPSVFIGITLLITDPMTSPKSKEGQFIYGILYGISIATLYSVLSFFDRPGVYDKILCVPILNYFSPHLDRAFKGKFRLKEIQLFDRPWVPMFLYSCLFLAILPVLNRDFHRSSFNFRKVYESFFNKSNSSLRNF